MARSEVVYFDDKGSDCKDRYYRRCVGRLRCEINLGKDGKGKRKRCKLSAATKTELYEKLDELREDMDQGSHRVPTQ